MDVQSASIGSLYDEFPPAIQARLAQTHAGDVENRLAALQALESAADARILDRIGELLQDEDYRIRCEAARLIGQFGPDGRRLAADLQGKLEDSSPLVRHCALLALSRVGGDLALEALLNYLGNAREDAVEPAIDALGRLGRIEAVPVIVGHLESDEATVVATTQRAIARIGPGGVDLVRPYLQSEQARARCAAASILAQWESLADQQQLERMARQDRDAVVRICALGALGRLGDTQAVEQLTQILVSPDSPHRDEAARALGVAATASAVRVLIRTLTSFHQENGMNAAQAALLSIGRGATQALREALTTGPPLRRALVAQTLGLLGDPSAEDSLESAAMDTDPMVREAAETALEILHIDSRR